MQPKLVNPVPDTGVDRPPTRPLLVNNAEAADPLAISRSSAYQLIWTEELTPVCIGGSVRFSVEHLERFVATRLGAR